MPRNTVAAPGGRAPASWSAQTGTLDDAQLFLCLTEGVSGFRHKGGGCMTEVMDGRRQLNPSLRAAGWKIRDLKAFYRICAFLSPVKT
jgi:hypothetical protein